MPFKHLRAKLSQVEIDKLGTVEERLQRTELEIVGLKHDLRTLIGILEKEMGKNFDPEGPIGRSDHAGPGPSVARMSPPHVHRDGPRAPILPPSIP